MKSKQLKQIQFNSDGYIESINLDGIKFVFNQKGIEFYNLPNCIEKKIDYEIIDDSCVAIDITINAKKDISERIAMYLGVDCRMDCYPEWQYKLFPTMLRLEKTHFYGYFMRPDGKILGICCDKQVASYKILYEGLGHLIESVEIDFINPQKQPERIENKLTGLKAGESLKRRFYLFNVECLEVFEKRVRDYCDIPFVFTEKYVVEKGERVKFEFLGEGEKYAISPRGNKINLPFTAKEFGEYKVFFKDKEKICESIIYCRKKLDFYLKRARTNALNKPQKATTNCESWYGFFSAYLAQIHYPNQELFIQTENLFNEVIPLMFDLNGCIPKVIPYRIQNVSTLISLLVAKYRASGYKDLSLLKTAGKFADYLISCQRDNGAFYNKAHNVYYTCVIYIAKSILELYNEANKIPEMKNDCKRYYLSVKRAIDDLVKNLDNIQTEGILTYEDGMISCSALQISMFALSLPKDERLPYIKAAEYMIDGHRCLEQNKIPDARMRGASLRFWEVQYDIQTKPNMMSSPHGWTAWTLYAKYYLYLLTAKVHYLKEFFDGLGACLQLMDKNGELRWAFICDPCVNAYYFDKSEKIGNKGTFNGKFSYKIIGEQYLPMISGWFKHTKQKITGGYLGCRLIHDEKNIEVVDEQGGCCDNDVHEIFKCLEETALKKAYIHFENGNVTTYNCKYKYGVIYPREEINEVVCYSDKPTEMIINGEKYLINNNISVIKN